MKPAVVIYRKLLRTIGNTLINESKSEIIHARRHCRHLFDQNRACTDSKKILKMIKTATECEGVLRKNIVFGKKKDGENIFSLMITNETELGCNLSIKKNPNLCFSK
jgi:hypothetical protein